MAELRLDSWSAEHGSSQEFDPGEEPRADVDLDAEAASVADVRWDAPVPAPVGPPTPERVAVIDGVRRVHARLFAEGDGVSAPALAGSWAVGAAWAGPHAEQGVIRIGHELIVGGGASVPALDVRVGAADLRFAPRSVPETDPREILAELQLVMRRNEAELARSLVTGHPDALVVRDGPLAYVTGDEPVLGLIKQRAREYLPDPQRALLARLGVGERTPMFVLEDPRGERRRRWSWYMRLAGRLPVEGSEVGVVRLELPGTVPLDEARRAADRSGAALPRLASDRLRDGRSPQNLHPIGRLEEQLHRRLGTRDLVSRRLIGRVAALSGAAPAGAAAGAAR